MTRLPKPRPSVPDPTARLRAELAGLGPVSMPPDVASRIGTTLAEAQRVAEPETTDDAGEHTATRPESILRSEPTRAVRATPGPGRRRPATRRRLGIALPAGLVAAAVVAIAAAVVTLRPGEPMPVGEESDLQAAGMGALGARDAGPLADPALRSGCLVAIGVPEPGATLLGARPYAVDGRPGTLLVLGTEVRGRFRLLVVEQGCGPAGGRLLSGATAGR